VKALPTLASDSTVRVSFHRDGMDPGAINDQLLPLNATDGFARSFDWWPHKGTREWVEMTFKAPSRVSESSVFWFDDTGSGECRVPAGWRLLYRDSGGQWTPISAASGYAIEKGKPSPLRFGTVTTDALRLEVELPAGFSGGIWEWTAK
jgi:uncharacterized protein